MHVKRGLLPMLNAANRARRRFRCEGTVADAKDATAEGERTSEKARTTLFRDDGDDERTERVNDDDDDDDAATFVPVAYIHGGTNATPRDALWCPIILGGD